MAAQQTETWDLWYPQAGATGLPFARGRVAAGAEMMLVHAAPPVLTVVVRNAEDQVLAKGENLPSTADTPIASLTRRGPQIERTDLWPGSAELGQLVLLAGGEVGALIAWWHAENHTEWRWQIELYNHR
jgi:hypothetical protein